MWDSTTRDAKKQGIGARLCRTMWTLALGLALSAPAFGEPIAFTASFGELLAFDIETGVAEPIGPIGLPGLSGLQGMTMSPEGRLYSLGWVDGLWELIELDTETGAGTIVGSVGDVRPTGLSFDARGRLWMTALEGLFLVDSGTGAATFWVLPEGVITTLAVRWRQLFVLTMQDDFFRLERLDPETGNLTPLWDVDVGLLITDSGFDRDGSFWFLARTEFAPLPFISVAYFRMPDLGTGEVELGFGTAYVPGDPEAGMREFAFPQWRGRIEGQR